MGRKKEKQLTDFMKDRSDQATGAATPAELRTPARWRPALAAVGAGVLAIVSGLAGSFLGVASERNTWPYGAPSEQDLAADLDGVYPTSACKANFVAVTSTPILAQDGSPLAKMELRRGSECHASWVWVDSAIAGVTVAKVLSRAPYGDLEELSVREEGRYYGRCRSG